MANLHKWFDCTMCGEINAISCTVVFSNEERQIDFTPVNRCKACGTRAKVLRYRLDPYPAPRYAP